MKIGASKAFVAPKNGNWGQWMEGKLERSHPGRQSNIIIIIIYNWSLGAGISSICPCHTYFWYWFGFYFTLFYPSNLAGNESKLQGDASIGIMTPLEFSRFNHGNYVFRRQTFHTGSNFVFGMIKVASVKAAGSLQIPFIRCLEKCRQMAFVAARS